MWGCRRQGLLRRRGHESFFSSSELYALPTRSTYLRQIGDIGVTLATMNRSLVPQPEDNPVQPFSGDAPSDCRSSWRYEVSDIDPSRIVEGGQLVSLCPARTPVDGENRPWYWSTGRTTTQPPRRPPPDAVVPVVPREAELDRSFSRHARRLGVNSGLMTVWPLSRLSSRIRSRRTRQEQVRNSKLHLHLRSLLWGRKVPNAKPFFPS